METNRTKKDHLSPMMKKSKDVKEHYTEPSPDTAEPDTPPFPSGVTRGLWIGALAGAIFGLLAAFLFKSGYLAIPGTEGMYSMTPATFYSFWTGIGIAAGILLIGSGTVISADNNK